MTDILRFTILGCGSSPGTPRINGDWGNCDPANPKNRRTRCAALVERVSDAGVTRVAIDTGPDFRNQMLMAGVRHLDAVVYTHPHADHIHGIDDLRTYAIDKRERIDVHADQPTLDRLMEAFAYCFKTPAGSSYPPILNANIIRHEESFTVQGKGGEITFSPIEQFHGDIISLGFRIAGLAYCPDTNGFPHHSIEKLRALDVLIIDALQYETHPSHLSLEQALNWVVRLAPKRAALTHMHVPLDYETVRRETPSNVEPAFDGMVFELLLVD